MALEAARARARVGRSGAWWCSSLRHAKASEAALRARVAKAQTQVEALNRRGRGRKRFEEIDELRQAVNVIVQRHQVEDFLWLRYDQQGTSHPVRAYRESRGGDQG